MFLNQISTKDLFSTNPGQVLGSRYDLNDSAFSSTQSNSQIEFYEISGSEENSQFSKKHVNSHSSQSPRNHCQTYLPVPFFNKDSNLARNPQANRQRYQQQLQANKANLRKREERDILDSIAITVKECTKEVAEVVESVKENIGHSIAGSRNELTKHLDEVKSSLSKHYEDVVRAIQYRDQDNEKVKALETELAAKSALIAELQEQVNKLSQQHEAQIIATLKEVYSEQQQLNRDQIHQLHQQQMETLGRNGEQHRDQQRHIDSLCLQQKKLEKDHQKQVTDLEGRFMKEIMMQQKQLQEQQAGLNKHYQQQLVESQLKQRRDIEEWLKNHIKEQEQLDTHRFEAIQQQKEHQIAELHTKQMEELETLVKHQLEAQQRQWGRQFMEEMNKFYACQNKDKIEMRNQVCQSLQQQSEQFKICQKQYEEQLEHLQQQHQEEMYKLREHLTSSVNEVSARINTRSVNVSSVQPCTHTNRNVSGVTTVPPGLIENHKSYQRYLSEPNTSHIPALASHMPDTSQEQLLQQEAAAKILPTASSLNTITKQLGISDPAIHLPSPSITQWSYEGLPMTSHGSHSGTNNSVTQEHTKPVWKFSNTAFVSPVSTSTWSSRSLFSKTKPSPVATVHPQVQAETAKQDENEQKQQDQLLHGMEQDCTSYEDSVSANNTVKTKKGNPPPNRKSKRVQKQKALVSSNESKSKKDTDKINKAISGTKGRKAKTPKPGTPNMPRRRTGRDNTSKAVQRKSNKASAKQETKALNKENSPDLPHNEDNLLNPVSYPWDKCIVQGHSNNSDDKGIVGMPLCTGEGIMKNENFAGSASPKSDLLDVDFFGSPILNGAQTMNCSSNSKETSSIPRSKAVRNRTNTLFAEDTTESRMVEINNLIRKQLKRKMVGGKTVRCDLTMVK